MTGRAPSRRRRIKRNRPRCVICDSKDAEKNHVGGQNHVAWFTMPFCRAHHDQFHTFLRAAGIDLEYTTDARDRVLRGLQACDIAHWVLTKRLQELNSRNDI